MFRRRFMARRQVGLMFTDQSSSKLNAQQSGIVYGSSPTGDSKIGVTYATGSDYTNLMLYKVSNNSLMTDDDETHLTSVYLVASFSNSFYIITKENNKPKYQRINSINDLQNYSNDYSYQWFLSGSTASFTIFNRQSNSLYLTVNSDNYLDISSSESATNFTRDGGVLSLVELSYSTWYPYVDTDLDKFLISKTKRNSVYLYSYSYEKIGSRFYYTLRKISSDDLANGNTIMIAVEGDNGYYYLLGKDDYSFQLTMRVTALAVGNTLTFSTKTGTASMTRYVYTVVKTSNSISFKSNYETSYYLSKPNTIEEGKELAFSYDPYVFQYTNAGGISVAIGKSNSYPYGISYIGNQIEASSVVANSGSTIVFKKNGLSWQPYYGSLITGETYAIAVRKAPVDENHPGDNTASYYLVGYDGTNLVAHEFEDIDDIVVTSDCEFVATSGTNGCGLVIGNNGLNINNNNLAMLDVSADWVYIGDASTPDNSRLWTVTTQTTNYYTEYSNADLEANTQATDTTCDIFLVQNGKVQIQADEFVDGQTYVLVFVDNGNHYAACVNGTDIVPVLYANSLPKNLPSDYHFVAEASGQGFLLTHNNQAMGVAVNTKLTIGYNAIWTYTGGTNE